MVNLVIPPTNKVLLQLDVFLPLSIFNYIFSFSSWTSIFKKNWYMLICLSISSSTWHPFNKKFKINKAVSFFDISKSILCKSFFSNNIYVNIFVFFHWYDFFNKKKGKILLAYLSFKYCQESYQSMKFLMKWMTKSLINKLMTFNCFI